tara:strand:+ start:961 stop:1887 length:927 start_codon:yes stop_codon:yes gene_type:complete
MDISATIFKSIFDNKTEKCIEFSSFDDFEKVLYDLSKKNIKSKRDAVLISPAIYKKNTTRANDNVIEWSGWCCVDVDDFEFEGDLKDELITRFGNLRFVCYSTASSTIDSPKFRLVFPTIGSIENNKIRRFWFGLQSELGELGDKQTKDLSRMYYIPAQYDGAFNFIFSNAGSAIDPDVLIQKFPMPEKANLNSFFDRLPDALQKEVLEYKKNKLDNDFSWSSYRDCPFWPKQLANEYRTITKTGWYHKMYQIMVAVAGNAIKSKYPINVDEITNLCREFDIDNGNWYKKRPIKKEADRALEYVYRNV